MSILGVAQSNNRRRLRIFVINAFVTEDGLTSGNPAAVVLVPPDESSPTDEEMQAVATQMNISETAFVRWTDTKSFSDIRIRWFTPCAEVDLCGHATLASTAALRTVISLPPIANLHTQRAGVLQVQSLDDGRIAMDFPVDRPSEIIEDTKVLKALRIDKGRVRRAKYDIVVELDNQEQVEKLVPDLAMMRTLDTRGVAVCSKGTDNNLAFVARFFAPAFAIDEDPVTGSMMCALAPMFLEDGAPARMARQLSKRGGLLHVALKQDRVEISGSASIIIDGELLL